MVDIFWSRLVERTVVLTGSDVMSSVVWALFVVFVSLWSLIGLKLDKLPVVSCKSVLPVVSCRFVLPVVFCRCNYARGALQLTYEGLNTVAHTMGVLVSVLGSQ